MKNWIESLANPCSCLCALFAMALPGQNLVFNSDFASGTTAGWTVTQLQGPPNSQVITVQSVPTNGSFSSPAVCFTAPSSFSSFEVAQTINLIPGAYEVRADMAGFSYGFPTSAASVGCYVDSSIQVGAAGSALWGNKVSSAIVVWISGTSMTIRAVFSGVSSALGGHVVAMDNVQVRPMRPIVAACYGSVAGGTYMGVPTIWRFAGTSGSLAFLVASMLPASIRQTFPPASGDLGLDPGSMVVMASPLLDQFGRATSIITMPVSPILVGAGMWWQPVQMTPSGGIDFGWEFMQSFEL